MIVNLGAGYGRFQRPQRRRASYTATLTAIDPCNRIVIVVDDGIATGATMHAALHAVRARSPARLIGAVPVASASSLQALRPLADEIVGLYVPHEFAAVSQYYELFDQVDDSTVIECLRRGSVVAKSS